MKRIDLDEYATSAPLDLTLGEVEALRLHRAVEITPIVDGGQPRWVVRARQHVGILQLGELELRIHPKVSVGLHVPYCELFGGRSPFEKR